MKEGQTAMSKTLTDSGIKTVFPEKTIAVHTSAGVRKTHPLPARANGKAALCRTALETAVLCAGKTLEDTRRLGKILYAYLSAEADRCTREGLFGEDRSQHFAGLDRDYNPEITREIRYVDLGSCKVLSDVEMPKPLCIFNGF